MTRSSAGITIVVSCVLGAVQADAQTPFFSKDQKSRSVAIVDDLDLDGFRELVVGDVTAQVSVLSGRTGSVLKTISGASGFGFTVTDLDDLDRDGVEEFAVTAPEKFFNGGRFFVYSGATLTEMFSHSDGARDFARDVSRCADLNSDGIGELLVSGSDTLVVSGAELASGQLVLLRTIKDGWVAADAGDVDRDGRSDIVVGFPYLSDRYCSSGEGGGQAFVFSGKDYHQIWKFKINDRCYCQSGSGGAPGPTFGFVVAGAGDVDGDSYADVMIGAPYASCGSSSFGYSGAIDVYAGVNGKLLFQYSHHNSDLHPDLGYTMSAIGDANHDGFDDFAFGGPSIVVGGQLEGQFGCYSGFDGELLYRFEFDQTDQRAFDGEDIDGDNRVDLAVTGLFPGWTAAYRLNDLFLDSALTGTTLDLTLSQSTPGNPFALFLVEVNGAPVWGFLGLGNFGGDGRFHTSFSTSGVPLADYGLLGLAVDPRGIAVQSNLEVVRIQ